MISSLLVCCLCLITVQMNDLYQETKGSRFHLVIFREITYGPQKAGQNLTEIAVIEPF